MTVTTTDLDIRTMASIDLGELMRVAGLQTRVDRKYVVPAEAIGEVVAGLGNDVRVLEIEDRRSFAYESVYFDTAALDSFHLAAHRRRRRFKVRTRTYLDSGECWLEVKVPGSRGSTVKERMPYDLADRDRLTATGRDFVGDSLRSAEIPPVDGALSPTLVTSYRRSTLYLPSSDSRLTVDTELAWGRPGSPRRSVRDAVVETKASAAATPADRLLWRHGHRPVRISKYATGLAALTPELPANAWHQTLQRHFRHHDTIARNS